MMSIILFVIGLFFLMKFLDKKLLMIFIQNMLFLFFFIYLFYFFNLSFYNSWSMIFFDYGIDKISFLMIMLSIWIVSLMFLSVLNMNIYYNKILVFQVLFLLISLIMFFFSMDLINFYLFFEISLIPIFLMIMGWGVQPERLQAGIYMIIYTLFASLPFLMILLLMNMNFNSLNLMYLIKMNLIFKINLFLVFGLMFVFLVKLPVYIVHLWLPKAHVEAPIFGSMILAGVLLKLGGYGIVRFMMIFLKFFYLNNLYFLCFIMIGSINISILCIRQIDLKMLIAYSSVVHMGFLFVGIYSFLNIGMMGGIVMMISHGLCSSGLFCLLNFSYKRTGSRNLLINKGLIQFFPMMSMWWFIFCSMNMAAPPSLNLVSEIYLMISMFKFSSWLFLYIFILSFFSGLYSIYLYSFSQHGKNFLISMMFYFNSIDEYLLMILHFIPMMLFFLNLWFF
uniref:NADH dehydrogenase subunit 4 n=1 Tax=Telenomus remus TaxID=1569972 RepID=UPI001BED46D0|nr:NADH dehydrogenase subunit 4 [Telenomus remus]QTE20727.1 NADH dehydrogenase subunit 4 [Telenomus remus]QUJ09549.1 NADH dehydrogenase subunit 4 [Telenomus remus]